MKYPLIALPLSTLLILTGCGGSSSGGDSTPTPAPVPAPTVTVTAPATATVGSAFNVQWSSTSATSCSSAFSSSTAASGTAAITEATDGAKTYSVTCTGAGGSATGSTSVTVQPLATPEGQWQGSSTGNGGSRTLSGVVTKENKFWLVYNSAGTPADPAGFFAGSASPSGQTAAGGSFNTATGLVEFNFEGVNAGLGSLTASYTGKATFDGTTLATLPSLRGSQGYTIDGVTDPLPSGLGAVLTQTPNPPTFSDGGTPWTIVPNANDPSGTPALVGTLVFAPYAVSVDLTASGFGTVALTVPSRQLQINGGTAAWDSSTRTLTLTGATFVETSPNVICDDGGTGFCASVPGPSDPTHGDVELTFAPDMINYTGVANAYQPIALLNVDYPTTPCLAEGGNNPCANNILTFSGAISNGTPATTTQTFTTTYDTTYEQTPDVATIVGNYTGNAGVDIALEAGSTFNIDGAGNITGATTNCTVAGTVATHSSGNIYDVTNLTFTGSSCTLASDTFSGIATLDVAANKVTVTAVNAGSDKGFLFVGVRP